jgi:capsular polysaccharide transport system permease protein
MVDTIFRVVYGPLYRQRHRLGLYIILIPMLVLSVYYLFIATERYVSESKVIVQSSSDLGGQLGGLSLPFLGAVGGANKQDALLLIEFIQSYDMLERLDKQFDLRKQFVLKGLDIVNRLPPWSTKEDFLNLYRAHIEVSLNDKNGVLTIGTLAQSAEQAQRINQAILVEAEKFINAVSQKSAREQLDFANQELLHSRKGLDEAKENLLGFQNKYGEIDPTASMQVSGGVIAGLEGQLAAREVEYKTLSSMMQDSAPQVVSLRHTIGSLRQQIADERKKQTSAKDGKGLNRMAARYLDVKAMVDFQTDVYRISLAATEKLRVEAARKVKNLSIISSPQVPEESKYPRRAYMLAAWFLGLCVLFGLVRLAIEIVEDHRD